MKKISFILLALLLAFGMVMVSCDTGSDDPADNGGNNGGESTTYTCLKIEGTTEADGMGDNSIALQFSLSSADLSSQEYTFSFKYFIESGSVNAVNSTAYQTGYGSSFKGAGTYGPTTGEWVEYSTDVTAAAGEVTSLFDADGSSDVVEIRPKFISQTAGEAIVVYIRDVKLSDGVTDLIDSADASAVNSGYIPSGNNSAGDPNTDPALTNGAEI